MRKTKWNTYGQVSFTSGSKDFLEKLQEILFENCIESHIYADGRPKNKSYYLRVIKRSEIEKLYYYLYADVSSIKFLKRKYDKYSELMKYNLK